MRVPGGGASCLDVGRPGSSALPPPTSFGARGLIPSWACSPAMAKFGGRTSTSSTVSLCFYCLLSTLTLLTPPTKITCAFPSLIASIVPLHPFRSVCFIPTNSTPCPTTSSNLVSCGSTSSVASLGGVFARVRCSFCFCSVFSFSTIRVFPFVPS